MSKRVVIIPDTQIPYHDERRLRALIRFIGETQPDEVIHIGDVMDYPQPSRWSKGTAAEFEGNVYVDSQRARTILLEPLREVFSGPIGFHSGNHDERCRQYLSKYAPALAKTGEFDLEKLLGLEEYDIQVLPEFYQVAPGWLTTHGHRGGIRLTQKSGQTALGAAIRFGQSVVMGHCFDEQTEILTPEGWVSHVELTNESVVLTANKETHHLEWNRVDEVHRYTDYDELIRVQASGLDLLVTPQHGLVTENRSSGEWGFPDAEAVFGKGVVIPLAGVHDQESLPLSDDEIRFIALVMADGSVDPTGHIRIAQSDDGKGDYEETERILNSLEFNFSKTLRYRGGEKQHGTYRNFDAYRFGVKSRAARDLIGKYLEGTSKNPTRGLAGMSLHQMNVFLDMYTLTDGNWNKEAPNSRQLGSKDREKLDFLQELAVRSGRRSSMGDRHLTVNERSSARTNKGSWSREPYDGVVWCVSVPNGTLVVRRNGKTAITQNTHRMGAMPHSYGVGNNVSTLWGIEVGNLMDYRKAQYLNGAAPNWQKGFVILDVARTKVQPTLVDMKGRSFQVDGKEYEVV